MDSVADTVTPNQFDVSYVLLDTSSGVNPKALCFAENVDQSDEDNTPLLEAEAVGTFNVITGVVVEFATVEDKSVPVVPNVRAETLVTVPEPPEPFEAAVILP